MYMHICTDTGATFSTAKLHLNGQEGSAVNMTHASSKEHLGPLRIGPRYQKEKKTRLPRATQSCMDGVQLGWAG